MPPSRFAWLAPLVSSLLLALVMLVINDWAVATPWRVFNQGEYWRAWTTSLVHADGEHLMNNIWALAGLSYLLAGYFGWWVFPFFTFVCAGFVNLVALSTYSPGQGLVGASGMVYFMASVWLTLYVLIERSIPVARRLMNATLFVMMLLVPHEFDQRISYRTHLAGFVAGSAFGSVYFHRMKSWIRAQEELHSVKPRSTAQELVDLNVHHDASVLGVEGHGGHDRSGLRDA